LRFNSTAFCQPESSALCPKKSKNIIFSSILFRLFFGFRANFQIVFKRFFHFFILLHVKLSSLSMEVPLAEKSHKPIFLKSRDGCPEFENLRNKNIFGLEDFSGQKKRNFLYFSFFEKKSIIPCQLVACGQK